MTKTVAIGGGHGHNTSGKRSPADEREWDFNAKIVESVIKHLKANGLSIIRLDDPTGATDVPLATRKAKGEKADIYVSIHNNAGPTGKWFDGGGTETFYYEGSANSKKLASLIHNEVVGVLKRPNRGLKSGNHLYECRATTPPACLLEALFFDSNQDIKLLRDKNVLANIGKAVAKGICAYFGISFKEATEPKPKPTPAPAPTPKPATETGLYRVYVDGVKIGSFKDPSKAIEDALKKNPAEIKVQKI